MALNPIHRRRLRLQELESKITPTTQLLADIDTSIETYTGSSPGNVTYLGTTAFFSASDYIHGRELWKTDGTAAGTVMVKDVLLGAASSDPENLVVMNNVLYFTTRKGSQRELWKSNGTANGTVLVKDVGTSNYYAELRLQVVGNNIFFASNSGTTGTELWKSDGTTAGTVLVKNIKADTGGNISSNPNYLRDVNGTLFFVARDATGQAIWKSNGTDAGTVRVTGLGFSFYPKLEPLNGKLIFTSDDGVLGEELWITDGTTNGTMLLKDINENDGYSSYATNFYKIGNTLYFSADDGINGQELWKTDGTTVGTTLVKDVSAGTASSSPNYMTDVNGTIFFTATTAATGYELWKTDGTDAGTVIVKDIAAGADHSEIRTPTNINGTLYFTATTPAAGAELWKSNGTDTGTVMVKDINPANDFTYIYPTRPFLVNGKILFGADDGTHGQELWQTDGTNAGTTLFKDIAQRPSSSNARDFANFQGKTFFVANDITHGREIWSTDGTVAGTSRITDLVAGFGSRYPTLLTTVGNTLYFVAENSAGTGLELWKSNGTSAGTSFVKTIKATSDPRYIALYNSNGKLFFTTETTTEGLELWTSDGTGAGTTLVKDIRPGILSSDIAFRATLGSTLYFTANDGTNGFELWKSDGTTAGTTLVKDIRPNAASSDIQYVTVLNGQLYFSARGATEGTELWKSDGTDTGTTLVKDIDAGNFGSYPSNLTVMNGMLYFRASSDTGTREELWKSDGTTGGTVLLKNISELPGYGSSPRSLTAVGNTLYFVADTDTQQGGLWKSDGTTNGTVLVKHLIGNDGYFSYNEPSALTNVGGTLYYTVDDGVHGRELWKSDGTTAGSVLVADIAEGLASGYPVLWAVNNNTLIMTADDFIHGRELWIESQAPPSNDPPTNITLSNAQVAENLGTGVAVGTFTTTDPDAGNTFTYTFVENASFPDNALFSIVGNELRTNDIFDFETDSSYSIRVRSTDNGGLFTQKSFTITIANGNDEPTDVLLSDANIAENQPAGTVVGLLNTTDVDAGETFTYTMFDSANYPDNASFTIVGNELRTTAVLDLNVQYAFAIRIQSADAGGLTFQKEFTINVIGEFNPPTIDNEPSIVLPMVRKNSTKHLGTSLYPFLLYADDLETPDSLGLSITGFRGAAGTWQIGSAESGPWTAITASESTPFTVPNSSFLRFLPARNAVGFAGLNYNIWDGALTSADSEVAWVPVNVTSPKYNADGEVIMRGTSEDALNPGGTKVSSLIGYLATEFAARTKLGIAITALEGDGTWQVRVGRTWQAITGVSETNARLLKSTDLIRFVPSSNWNGLATVEYHAWKMPATTTFPTFGNITTDPTNYSVAKATGSLFVAAVNDAPTMDISVPQLFDTTPRTIESLVTGTLDGDGHVKGIAITRASGVNGRWEYSLNGNGTWIAVGGVKAAAGLLLDLNDEIRFVPTAGAATASGSFDYKAWDNSTAYNSGQKKRISGTGFSVKIEKATFSMGNNAPTFKTGPVPTVNLKLALVTAKKVSIVASSLLGLMTDDRGSLKGLALTGTTGTGTWEYSLDGRTWLVVGDLSHTKLLLRSTDRLRYVSATNQSEVPSLTYLAWDQTLGAAGDRIDADNDSFSTTSLTANINIA